MRSLFFVRRSTKARRRDCTERQRSGVIASCSFLQIGSVSCLVLFRAGAVHAHYVHAEPSRALPRRLHNDYSTFHQNTILDPIIPLRIPNDTIDSQYELHAQLLLPCDPVLCLRVLGLAPRRFFGRIYPRCVWMLLLRDWLCMFHQNGTPVAYLY